MEISMGTFKAMLTPLYQLNNQTLFAYIQMPAIFWGQEKNKEYLTIN